MVTVDVDSLDVTPNDCPLGEDPAVPAPRPPASMEAGGGPG